MKKITALSIAVVALFAKPVYAQSVASAWLGPISIQLIDLDVNDGIAPSILWTSEGTRAISQITTPPSDYVEAGVYVPSATFLTRSFLVSTTNANMATNITGSNLAEATLSASGNSQANQAYFSGAARAEGTFILSANTQATFSATGNTFVQIDDGLNEYALAGIHMLYRIGGSKDEENLITDIGDLGYAGTASDLAMLSMSFSNTSLLDTSGHFEFMSYVAGYSKLPPSAVPVPAALPLMLSGLGVLGVAARKRRSQQNS